MTAPTHSRGVVASLGASVLFGVIFYVAGVVDATSEAVFGWRMIVTAICAVLIVAVPACRQAYGALGRVLRSTWWMPVALVLTSALVGLQMWLFAWAPDHGKALDASLGYLLLPIVLVLIGRGAFAEQVTRLQWGAVLLAAVAVAVKIATAGVPSWVTPAVCLGYGLYFAVRRRLRLDQPIAFAAESLVMSPVCVLLVCTTSRGIAAGADPAVLGVGLAGAVAMTAYVTASKLLTMPVFGLLTYVEPVLLFVVALLLGESLHPADGVVYGLLAVALGLLAAGSFTGRKPLRRRAVPHLPHVESEPTAGR